MKKSDKIAVVDKVREAFLGVRLAIVAECSGMSVNQMTGLRKQLHGTQARLKVVKNTLAVRAMEGTPVLPIQPLFKGQLALVLGYDDPVAPAKALCDFIRNEQCKDKIILKGGVLDGKALDALSVGAVAELPSTPELLSMMVSVLQGPIRGFVVSLHQIIRGVVALLAAIQEEKTKKGDSAMTVTEEKMSKDDFIKAVESMTVLELSDLVKGLEDRFGVTAAAPVGVMAAPAVSGEASVAEEQTSFDVVLVSNLPEKKIQVIKVVREITALGLKEAKDLVEGVPKPVKEGVSKEESDAIKKKLEDVGATVEVK